MDPGQKPNHMSPQRFWMHEHMQRLSGLDDVTGIELFALLHIATNLSDALHNRACGEEALSAPRFGLLLRLLTEEQLGRTDGLTPTALSHHQSVSKNTISSLLRGLEAQGLIQRTIDPQDYRAFRIQLTAAGRELVTATAPARLQQLNDIAVGLTTSERQMLVTFLGKLCRTLFARLGSTRCE